VFKSTGEEAQTCRSRDGLGKEEGSTFGYKLYVKTDTDRDLVRY